MDQTLERLQNWYLSNCNEDWEHEYGVKIDTLDNPGWGIAIDLVGTGLEEKAFPNPTYGTGEDADVSGNDWLSCKVADGKFIAAGGPTKLKEMLTVFLDWAEPLPADKTHRP